MAYVDVPGGQVFTYDLNPTSNDPVVMIHGLLTNHTVFYMCGAFALAKKHRVTMYDLRGHGLTSLAPSDFRMTTLSEDLFALMDALNLDQVRLVGYSYGAAVAIQAALSQPERIGQLALIEPFGLSRVKSPTTETQMHANVAAYSLKRRAMIRQRRLGQLHEQVRILFVEHGLGEALSADADFFNTMPLDQLTVSTLLLCGRWSPYFADAKLVAKRIPHAHVAVAWGGHNLPVTRARWVRRGLTRWGEEDTHVYQRA